MKTSKTKPFISTAKIFGVLLVLIVLLLCGVLKTLIDERLLIEALEENNGVGSQKIVGIDCGPLNQRIEDVRLLKMDDAHLLHNHRHVEKLSVDDYHEVVEFELRDIGRLPRLKHFDRWLYFTNSIASLAEQMPNLEVLDISVEGREQAKELHSFPAQWRHQITSLNLRFATFGRTKSSPTIGESFPNLRKLHLVRYYQKKPVEISSFGKLSHLKAFTFHQPFSGSVQTLPDQLPSLSSLSLSAELSSGQIQELLSAPKSWREQMTHAELKWDFQGIPEFEVVSMFPNLKELTILSSDDNGFKVTQLGMLLQLEKLVILRVDGNLASLPEQTPNLNFFSFRAGGTQDERSPKKRWEEMQQQLPERWRESVEFDYPMWIR